MLDRTRRTRCAADPDRPAVLAATRTGRHRVRATRGELADLADGYAAALHARGLAAGDTVGVAVRPGPAGAGGDARRAPARAARRRARPGAPARTCCAPGSPWPGPTLVLADAAAQAVAGLGRARWPAGPSWPCPTWPRWRPVRDGRAAAARLRARADAARRGRVPGRAGDGDGDAVIVFTSGTTSRPRAVVHTRAGLAAGMRAVARPGPARARTSRCSAARSSCWCRRWPAAPRSRCPARSPRVLARQLRPARARRPPI